MAVPHLYEAVLDQARQGRAANQVLVGVKSSCWVVLKGVAIEAAPCPSLILWKTALDLLEVLKQDGRKKKHLLYVVFLLRQAMVSAQA
jgi:hypothetical protein